MPAWSWSEGWNSAYKNVTPQEEFSIWFFSSDSRCEESVSFYKIKRYLNGEKAIFNPQRKETSKHQTNPKNPKQFWKLARKEKGFTLL